MQDMIHKIVDFVQNFVQNNNMFFSIFMGIFIIILESIIPILPLALFIAINMIAFGNVLGFIISWVSTILGCSLAYYLSKKLRPFVIQKLKKNSKIISIMEFIKNISFSKLVLILSIPFTPAFSVNLASGLSNMSYKKYFLSLVISKIFLVYFWGFIGTTLVESITDLDILIKLAFLLIISFILSKIVIKKFDVC